MDSLKGTNEKTSRAWRGLVFFLLFVLAGCQSKTTEQWDYKVVDQPQGDELSLRIEFLEDRLTKRPEAFLEMAELAGLYLQRGKARRSETDLEKSLEWMDRSLEIIENPSALAVKADYLQMKHEFGQAYAVVEKMLSEQSTNLETLVMGVRIRLAQGDAERAAALLENLPKSPLSSILFLRGQVAELQGENDRARQLLEDSIRRETDGASPGQAAQRRGVLARLEIRDGNWERADALLEAAHRIPVEQPLTEVLRAEVLVHKKDYSEAEKLLRASYETYRDATFLLRLGEVEALAGKQDAAQRTYATAAELLKKDNLGHERDLALALFYLDPKKHAEEIAQLMSKELERRQDFETLRIQRLIDGK